MRTALLIAFAFAATAAAAQSPYDAIVAQLKRGDTDVNYAVFRLAYAASDGYDPYGTGAQNRSRRMLVAFVDPEASAAALAIADSVLADNYTDINAHIVTSVLVGRQQDSARSAYHTAVARGLVGSIIDGGAGRSPESPMHVISVDEEYAVLRVLGFEGSDQAAVDCGEARCDRLEARDIDTGETHTLYFDVTIPTQHLQRRGRE